MQTLVTHWEQFLLLYLAGSIGLGFAVYVIVAEALCWRGTRHWIRTHFQRWYPATPIYGSADPYRTKGPDALPNRRQGR